MVDEAEIVTGRSNYATDDNLVKRQSIFSYLDPETSSGGSPIDRVEWSPEDSVADLGCGNGLWLAHARNQAGWVLGLDMSLGMLGAARRTVGSGVALAQGDVQSLPLRTASFDGLLVMHMLYHVPDLARALAEVSRVLRPAGWVLVTTNSGVPTRAADLYQRCVEEVIGVSVKNLLPPLPFDGENGAELLAPFFPRIEPAQHVAGFAVTDPAALLPPLESVVEPVEATIGRSPDWPAVHAEVLARATEEIRDRGAYRYEQRVVSFLCRA
ncbi:MAG TPA: class I SAM-dependent methyltransferase [Acidimicrobiales bacterium]|nr:class I SAM-dependent methyltransferase [Acidimicrobiales bacterium]